MADMTKKMAGHAVFGPGEVLVEAVYGLGKAMLRAADGAGKRRPLGGPGYEREYDGVVDGRDGFGFSAEVKGNGVLALTNRRVLFFKKATVVGVPKTITAELAADELVSAAYDRPMLIVEFADGSVVGLHVPRNQKPKAFVEAVERAAATVESGE